MNKPAPCQNCPCASLCALGTVACGAFAAYVHGTRAMQRFGRKPSREWFAVCFPKTDEKGEVLAAILAAMGKGLLPPAARPEF